MALSEWPEHFREDKSPGGEMVVVEFETEMLVAVVTDNAIGLKADEESREVDYWIPISQIDGDAPGEGEWIESLAMPRWLAEEKGLLDS